MKRLQQSKDKQRQSPKTNSIQRPLREEENEQPLKRRKVDKNLAVPASPTRVIQPQIVHTSPARVILGIDKGLRAQDVSLKRPKQTTGISSRLDVSKSPPKVKSFSERLAESRDGEIERQAKAERVQNARGKGFGVQLDYGLISTTKNDPVSKSSSQFVSKIDNAITAREVTKIVPKPARRKAQFASTDDPLLIEPFSGLHVSKRTIPEGVVSRALEGKEIFTLPRLLKEVKSPDYYPPDCESDYIVMGIIANKTTPLETKVGANTRKHGSNSTTAEDAEVGDNKFLVMKLTDLEWEIDLFLFGAAFKRYWKLTPGTLVALLNPSIMPPRPQQRDSGKFSLKLSGQNAFSYSDEVDDMTADAELLEIGTARDLDFCHATKKDGNKCSDWIDKRRTAYCDFHTNINLDKTRAGRMEVNGLFRYTDGKGAKSSNGENPFQRKDWKNRVVKDGEGYASKNRQGSLDRTRKDAETGERYFMIPEVQGPGMAAKLLDSDEVFAGDRLRKKLREAEREKVIATKLGRLGNGAGAEYLRAGNGEESRSSEENHHEPSTRKEELKDASSLGLIATVNQVRLSPVKGRKKAIYELGEPLGWAGANKRGLLAKQNENNNGSELEKGQSSLDSIFTPGIKGNKRTAQDVNMLGRSTSPNKKARFMIGQGIKVPGVDSLETTAVERGQRSAYGNDDTDKNNDNDNEDDDDDDDDLDIV